MEVNVEILKFNCKKKNLRVQRKILRFHIAPPKIKKFFLVLENNFKWFFMAKIVEFDIQRQKKKKKTTDLNLKNYKIY